MIKDKEGNNLDKKTIFIKILLRIDTILKEFELMLLRFVGHIPFHTLRKVIYFIAGVKIGNNSYIHMWANFFNPRNVVIGEGTIIGDHCFLDGRDKLTIGSNTDIASSVLIYNSEHDINSINFKAIIAPVEIGDYVFIGPRAIILPGVKIGKGAIVGAGAVVTKNIPEYKIYGGVPAREIGERNLHEPHYKLGRPALFQ